MELSVELLLSVAGSLQSRFLFMARQVLGTLPHVTSDHGSSSELTVRYVVNMFSVIKVNCRLLLVDVFV